MSKTINKEAIKLRVEARRKEIERQKRIDEAKKRFEERRALNENKGKAPRTVRAPRPINENRNAVRRPVITEANLVNRAPKRKETLTESINRLNTVNKVPTALRKSYTMLAENIASFEKSRKALQENFNASSQRSDVNIGGVQTFFDIFYGYFPQLVAPHIASVQPMKTENGHIFYMEYVAGSAKGSVAADEVLINPFEVNSQYEYTSDKATLGKVASGQTEIQGPLWAPVKDVFVNGVKHTGNISTTGGVLKVTSLTAGDLVEYTYDNAFAPTDVPLLKPNIKSLPIAARFRTIRTNHAFTAAYGAEAEHGIKLGEKLADAAMEQLKREADLDILFKAFSAAENKVTWNKAAGVAVGGYQEHKLSLKDAIATAANLIFKKSKRVRGNVIVVGVDVLTVVETLPDFNGVDLGEQLPGAAVVGKLGKMPVILSPDVPSNEFLVLYKGAKDNFDAGIVFAPYLPVFATEPAILDDFVVRQAFITAYATKVVNKNYFVGGQIINDPVALPIYLISKDGSLGEGLEGLGTIDEDAVLDIFG